MKQDRPLNAEFQDFRDGFASRMVDEDASGFAEEDDTIPDFEPYVADPSDDLVAMPLVSVNVNQTVPLRDVLFSLAAQADIDIELDPRITGSIIFTARDKPLDVVVRRIARIAGLRYEFEEDFLRLELDTPYIKNYKLDYINIIRENSGSISNDVAVVTGDGADTGSSFESSTDSESDFWGEMEANLEQILEAQLSNVLRTEQDPEVVSLNQPQRAPVEGVGGGQTPDAILEISALPPVQGSGGFGATGPGGGAREEPAASFSMNRQAGIISVFATDRKHEEVKAFLDEVKRSVTAQVLIEAKVLEVELTDEFSTGINWDEIEIGNKAQFDFDFPAAALSPAVDPLNTAFNFALDVGEVNTVISAISRFGTVRALSSPRITVMNNQVAVLNVADNLVFFEIDIETTRDEFGTDTDVDSQIRNVPEGVLINVQPSINLDERTISLSIRPTITNVEEFVNDPAVAFQAAELAGDDPDAAEAVSGVASAVPIVQVQEFDSIMTMNSGQAIIMGGLMQDRSTTEQRGIPVLQEIPFIGNAFRSNNDTVEKSELVVFIKATIIDRHKSNVHATDKEFYRLYSADRRPLDL